MFSLDYKTIMKKKKLLCTNCEKYRKYRKTKILFKKINKGKQMLLFIKITIKYLIKSV